MVRNASAAVDMAEIHLENVLLVMERLTFCKDTAAYVVGGARRLASLIESGEIEVVKGSGAPNSKWRCNAAQVLRHCRNMRK